MIKLPELPKFDHLKSWHPDDVERLLKKYGRKCATAATHAANRERHQQENEQIAELTEALKNIMKWQVKNVDKWHNSAYDDAHRVLERIDAQRDKETK